MIYSNNESFLQKVALNSLLHTHFKQVNIKQLYKTINAINQVLCVKIITESNILINPTEDMTVRKILF